MGYSLVFSGQGSEKVGMLRDAICSYDYAADIVGKATELVGVDFFKVIASNERSVISDPHVNQILIFMFHNIYSKLIIEVMGAEPDFIMGHSVGQLCAYSVAGVLSLDDALQFLTRRTEIINDSSIQVEASFVNCFGLRYSVADMIIKENGLESEVKIALHNQEDNVVLAVTDSAREKITELSGQYKFITKDMIVARPYHSSFMGKFNEKLIPIIENLIFKDAKFPILMNNSCRLTTSAEEIKAETKIQMVEPVYWYKSLSNTYCDNYIVLDPSIGQVKILRKIVNGKIFSIVNNASIKSLDGLQVCTV